MTLEERFKRVSNHLVGLWRFRERTEDKKWAATYFFRGKYHDIYPVKYPAKALDIVYGNIVKMRNSDRTRERNRNLETRNETN